MRQLGSTNIGFYNWYNITFQYTKITLIKPPRAYSSLLLMIFFYNSDTLEVEILTNSYLNWNRIKRRLWVKMSGIWTPFAFRPNWGILSSVASVDLRFGATKMDSTVYATLCPYHAYINSYIVNERFKLFLNLRIFGKSRLNFDKIFCWSELFHFTPHLKKVQACHQNLRLNFPWYSSTWII